MRSARAATRLSRGSPWCFRGAALTTAVGLAAYATSLGFDFVYDDAWTILQNPHLDRPLLALLRSLFDGSAARAEVPDATRPAMIVSLWLDRSLFGRSPIGFHAHSLFMHLVCSLAAGAAAWSLARKRTVAVVAALFFAGAPLQAEVAVAINYREDSIAGLGVLVALAVLFRPSARVDRAGLSLAVSALFLWSLLGKESAACLPLALAAIFALRPPSAAWWRARKRTLTSLGAVMLAWGAWRALVTVGAPDLPRVGAPLVERLETFGRLAMDAALRTLAPFRSAPELPTPKSPSLLWLCALLALVIACFVAARRREWRTPALALLIVFAAWLPASPLVGPINPRADRYLYSAMLGAGMAWGVLMSRVTGGVSKRFGARGRLLLLAVLGGALAVAGHGAASPWRTESALWMRATETSPHSSRAWAGRSRAARRNGVVGEAVQFGRRAVELSPRFGPARVTLAYALIASGDLEAARSELDVAAGLSPVPRGVERGRECLGMPAIEARACVTGELPSR